MMEWAVLYNGLEKAFMLAVGIIGYLIRSSLKQQAQTNERVERVLQEILVQVNKTNGRVGVIEEWKRNHEKSVDGIHLGFREWLTNLSTQVNELIKNRR